MKLNGHFCRGVLARQAAGGAGRRAPRTAGGGGGCHLNHTLHLWAQYFPLYLRGTVVTLELTAACLAAGLLGGLLLALVRMGRSRILRNLAAAYIEVFRATPVIVLLFLAYFGLAQMGFTLPAFACVVLTLGAFYSALYCEVYRSGVEAVPRGQWEAAEALGLGRGRVLRRVILPQALLAILPPATNRAADVLKDTSLVVTISGVSEIMYQAYGAASNTFAPMSMFVLAAIFYFPLYLILSRVVRGWEVRHAARR